MMSASMSVTSRRVALVATALVVVVGNTVVGGAVAQRLPYLLAGLAVAALMQAFWEERATRWLVASTTTMLAALLVSITFSVANSGRSVTQRADSATTTEPAPTSTSLLSGTDVPAEVAGVAETRSDAERLVACEAALEQIAAAIRSTGNDVDSSLLTTPTTSGDATQIDRRLQSCEVRLEAIAATLPG